MSPLDKIKGPTDSVADLERQLEHERSNSTKAASAVQSAEARYDELGTATALKSLQKAQSGAAAAVQRVARAERLLASAIEAERSNHRADLERKLIDLSAEDEKLIKADGKLAKQYAETAILLANIKAERRDLNRRQAENGSRADAIATELGRETHVRPIRDWTPTLVAVRPHVEKFINGLDSNDPRRAYLREIVPEAKPLFQSHGFTPAKAVI